MACGGCGGCIRAVRAKYGLIDMEETQIERNPDEGVPCIVYYLWSSGDKRRYIGQTSEDLRRRLSKHKQQAKRGITTPVAKWVREQLAAGHLVDIEEIAGTDRSVWNRTEIDAIQIACDRGWELLNVQSGGGAREGYTNRPMNEKTRKKISEAMAGRKLTQEHKDKIGRGSRKAWARRDPH